MIDSFQREVLYLAMSVRFSLGYAQKSGISNKIGCYPTICRTSRGQQFNNRAVEPEPKQSYMTGVTNFQMVEPEAEPEIWVLVQQT